MNGEELQREQEEKDAKRLLLPNNLKHSDTVDVSLFKKLLKAHNVVFVPCGVASATFMTALMKSLSADPQHLENLLVSLVPPIVTPVRFPAAVGPPLFQ